MVYGDQLAFFNEQVRVFDYFSMKPEVVGGYENRQDLGKVRGILQYVKQGLLKEENDSIGNVDIPTFWTKQTLNIGTYYIQKGDEIFRIKGHSDWTHEGNFNCYILETVIGLTDEQEEFDYVDIGQGSYL